MSPLTCALGTDHAAIGMAPATLQRQDIARRIPHQNSMCLLDRVIAWDSQQICCETDSHRSLDNPMRAHGRLGASCGIEYAAQAMAVHGALIAESLGGAGTSNAVHARGGSLVSVRCVTLLVLALDNVVGQLTVNAERVSGNAGNVLYSFTVLDGLKSLVSGRAIVVLDSPDPVTSPAAA